MHKPDLKSLVKPMKIEAMKKTDVLAKIMLIIFKLCSLVRQAHDYKHSLVDGEANAQF